jgi:GNAT superfamily N-acetyltransferase
VTATPVDAIRYEVDSADEDELRELWTVVWERPPRASLARVLAASFGHVGARDGATLIGFVNLVSDGGEHAFLLDTSVHPDYRRRGIWTALVTRAIDIARTRGAVWLHVDFAQRYASFYRRCGFRPTEAGLIALQGNSRRNTRGIALS